MFNLKQATRTCYLDAPLSDVCIGTLAAPTYLPAHYFKNEDGDGGFQEFNLIGGGVAANNPVLKNSIYLRIRKGLIQFYLTTIIVFQIELFRLW